MSDPIVPRHDAIPDGRTGSHPEPPGPDGEAFHRLTARLAALDLDPPTVEMLTAVLNADLDPRAGC
jgi:hypothetical protein